QHRLRPPARAGRARARQGPPAPGPLRARPGPPGGLPHRAGPAVGPGRAGGAPGSVKRALDAFLAHLRGEKDASPHTVRAYGRDLLQFAAHLEEQMGRPPRLGDADVLAIRGFLAFLHEKGCGRATVARKLASLRTFFRYLNREGLVKTN